MSKKQNSKRDCFAALAMTKKWVSAAMLVLAGCAAQVQKPMRVCPGKEFAAEALSVLRSRSRNAVSLKGSGQCILQYYAEGKRRKENFPVKLWANPPVEIYLQGDVAFDPRGIVLGSDEHEFWLAIKLKEISSYWWGEWSEETCLEKLLISPKLVLEAFGIAVVDGEKKGRENWSLSSKGAFDVLTKREGSTETQKIYIEACDYLVRKIVYLDADGKVAAITELGKYKEISEGFFVPAFVKIITRSEDSEKKPVNITFNLKSVKSVNFTEKQRNRLFSRSEPRGFKHIYKISENCDVIEQP